MAEALYLDHAATSPLRPDARQAWLSACDQALNASSVHSLGRNGKAKLEEARTQILADLDQLGANLIFTSGATEANALALKQAEGFDQIIFGATEHDSVFLAHPNAVILPVDSNGSHELEALKSLLSNGLKSFIAIMSANNETGALSDISHIGELCRAHKAWLHVDAVQSPFGIVNADSIALSAHKLGGSQGVGALVSRHTLKPLWRGGGQEKGARAGTENIAGIVAFSAALHAAKLSSIDWLDAKLEIESRLESDGCTILSKAIPRAPHILAFVNPHWSSQLQLMHMDLGGVCVSSGSACSSGKVKDSRVAKAMGFEALAGNILRVSGGWTTRPEDWQRFYDLWKLGFEAFLARKSVSAQVTA